MGQTGRQRRGNGSGVGPSSSSIAAKRGPAAFSSFGGQAGKVGSLLFPGRAYYSGAFYAQCSGQGRHRICVV